MSPTTTSAAAACVRCRRATRLAGARLFISWHVVVTIRRSSIEMTFTGLQLTAWCHTVPAEPCDMRNMEVRDCIYDLLLGFEVPPWSDAFATANAVLPRLEHT